MSAHDSILSKMYSVVGALMLLEFLAQFYTIASSGFITVANEIANAGVSRVAVQDIEPFSAAHAVIGVFIVKGFETFVESAQPFPGRARSHQKCRRAIIHIPAKHIHRREWSVAAAVSETGAIAPYDASGLLQGPIQQDQTSAHRSDD